LTTALSAFDPSAFAPPDPPASDAFDISLFSCPPVPSAQSFDISACALTLSLLPEFNPGAFTPPDPVNSFDVGTFSLPPHAICIQYWHVHSA
jgi:hypothetical protein